MNAKLKSFSFPFLTPVLIVSVLLLFGLLLISVAFGPNFAMNYKDIFRLVLRISTLLSTLGFSYCVIGYHFKILRGDELKLRIHFEALNISFTTSIVSLFIIIFIGIIFWPKMLNWTLIFLAVIAIISYLISVEFIKEKYQ